MKECDKRKEDKIMKSGEIKGRGTNLDHPSDEKEIFSDFSAETNITAMETRIFQECHLLT